MKDIGTKMLITERLILRKFQKGDAMQVYKNWGSDKECNRTVGWKLHESIEETAEMLDDWIAEYENINSYNWAVELKETGEVIGNIQVVKIKAKHSNCEVGYCYGSKWWNKGYATEALKVVIKFLLFECDFNLVEATHLRSNPASGRVMIKSGMIFDAVLRERKWNKNEKRFEDLFYYSIKKDEVID